MTSPTPPDAKADTLWAVHVIGSDDVVPVASYLDALRVANAFNTWWQELKTRKPLHEYDPRVWASPIEYDGDAESHAEWVANPSPDYAPFFPTPPVEGA